MKDEWHFLEAIDFNVHCSAFNKKSMAKHWLQVQKFTRVGLPALKKPASM